MHFSVLVVGDHTYEDDLAPLVQQGKADYFSLTKGSFERYNLPSELMELSYYNLWTFNVLRAVKDKLVRQLIDDNDAMTEQVYNSAIAKLSPYDIEYAGNVNWQLMSNMTIERELQSFFWMKERFATNLHYLYPEILFEEDSSDEEIITKYNVWAPVVIYDLTKPHPFWFDRGHGDQARIIRVQQAQYIKNISPDSKVTLYHCHV